MYSISKINIENLMTQLGLTIRPYETKIINNKNEDKSKIDFVTIHVSTANSYHPYQHNHMSTSVINKFNDNMSEASFYTQFNININGLQTMYPSGLNVDINNSTTREKFQQVEDYLKLLYVLANKNFATALIEVKGDINFKDDVPVITNLHYMIKDKMFNKAITDNTNNLDAFAYINEKLHQNNMFYEHDKMNDIIKTFEMLII